MREDVTYITFDLIGLDVFSRCIFDRFTWLTRCQIKYIVHVFGGLLLVNFTHIIQGYLTGTGTNRRLLQRQLTHWGQAMHICVSKLTIIGSDNGLPLGCQAIFWTNAGKLLIGPLGTNFSEILIEI